MLQVYDVRVTKTLELRLKWFDDEMPETSSAELIVEGAGGERQEYRLGAAPCGIGRAIQNTIVLASDMVSRNHAMVQKNETGGYSVFDLGSRNGTFLNGRRLGRPVGLRNGDVLSIGSYHLVFSDAESNSPVIARTTQSDPQQTVAHVVLRDIIVLVVDIRDFTELARGLGEARIADVIGAFNRETGAVFEAAGSWGVKYIGDAVMSVWAHEGGAELALLSTVFESMIAIHKLAGRFQARYDLPRPLEIGAGINIGRASLGNLGGGVTSDYTALGDVVNKAFRLESATRTLDADVAFGDEVRERLGAGVGNGLVSVSRVQLKGYAEVSNVYSTRAARLGDLLTELKLGAG